MDFGERGRTERPTVSVIVSVLEKGGMLNVEGRRGPLPVDNCTHESRASLDVAQSLLTSRHWCPHWMLCYRELHTVSMYSNEQRGAAVRATLARIASLSRRAQFRTAGTCKANAEVVPMLTTPTTLQLSVRTDGGGLSPQPPRPKPTIVPSVRATSAIVLVLPPSTPRI